MKAEAAIVRGYRFGMFEVELASASVRKDGVPVRLRGKPFDILLVLLGRPGELVSRDDLRNRLWGSDTFVDFDHGLNAAMNRLRDAIGDAAENPRFIQTIPRRGYRFIAPVEPVLTPAPPEVQPRPAATPSDAVPAGTGTVPRWWGRALAPVCLVAAAALTAWVVWPGAGAATANRGRRMIAVLPFENLSADPDQAYFSAGISDELIAQLGALNPDALGVIARTTAAQYARGTATAREIGKSLGVDYVLEGAVRRSGQQVRITAQLIDTTRQTQVWSETYDQELQDVLLTQRDVAMRVAEALTMSVLGTRPVPKMRSAAAYEAYLRGRYLRHQGSYQSLTRAREYFEQAIALDPEYAAAHAGVADVHHVLGGPGWEYGPPRDLLPRALESAARAIELDPQLADGYAVRGMSRLWFDWDPRGAEQDLRRAISLNPSFALAHQYLSTALVAQGRTDEAIASARRASELDPLSPTAGTTLAYRYYYQGNYREALKQFARVLEIAPAFASARLGQAQTYRELGRIEASLDALKRAIAAAPDRIYLQAHLAYAEARRGNLDEARRIEARLTEAARTGYVAPYHLALVAAGLNQRAALRAHIERVLADRSGWMMFLLLEREFAAYRADLSDLIAGAGQRGPGTGPEVVSRAR